MTHVCFFLLLAHKFSSRWMKNGTLWFAPICASCVVRLTCRALFDVTAWNRKSRLSVSGCPTFPHRLVPARGLRGERVRPRRFSQRFHQQLRRAPSLLRVASDLTAPLRPSLRVASSSPIQLLDVVYHLQSSRGTCLFSACSPCLFRQFGKGIFGCRRGIFVGFGWFWVVVVDLVAARAFGVGCWRGISIVFALDFRGFCVVYICLQ